MLSNQLLESPEKNRSLVTVRARVRIPFLQYETEGEVLTFSNLPDRGEHLLIGFKGWQENSTPLVRIHSECLTGDVFSSGRCDCGPQLAEAIRLLSSNGGILLYLRQEGRGIGLYNKLDAYVLQTLGLDTYQANETLGFSHDQRDYSCAASMLKAVNVNQIQLLSNNPDKRDQLIQNGIDVVAQKNTTTYENKSNRSYLLAKVRVTQHKLGLK